MKLYYNAKIFTSSSEMEKANAMLVKDNKFVWVGDIKDFKEQGDIKKIDLQGKRVLPGLVDAHVHPIYLADAYQQITVLPPNIYSIEDLIEHIKERAKTTKEGEWIMGWGFEEAKLKEKRTPTKHDLDKATTKHPVFISRSCVHIGVTNSKGLEIANITKETKDPKDGVIDRDLNGEPNGILRETAKFDFTNNNIKPLSKEESQNNLIELSKILNAHGITTVTEMLGLSEPIDYYKIYKDASENGFTQRISISYRWDLIDTSKLNKEKTDRTKQVFIGGVKVVGDGSIGGKTAWFKEHYLNQPDNYGMPTTSKEEILKAYDIAKSNNLGLWVHGIGTKTIDLITQTLKDKEPWLKDEASIRIEHCTAPSEEALKIMKDKDITVVSQPVFQFAEIEAYLESIGEERTSKTYPHRTILDNNIKLVLSSDAPATSWADPANPFVGMYGAITKTCYNGFKSGLDEKINITEAIKAYTIDAIKCLGIPNLGMIKEGYIADFVVLNHDIINEDPKVLLDTKAEQTFMNGKKVYPV